MPAPGGRRVAMAGEKDRDGMSQTMKALVLRGPNDLLVARVPAPVPRPGECVVRVGACGICGSDLRYLAGENPWAKHTLGYEKPNPPNMILGHEIGGHVDGVPVAVMAFKACGRCPECRRGLESLCANTAHLGHGAGWVGREYNPGGMAELCPAWEEHVFELPEGCSCVEGTFLDGLAVAVHAVRRAGPRVGATALIVGAGPIGLLIMQTWKALGGGACWVVDVYDVALECARELGADHVRKCTPGSLEAVARDVLSQTQGRGVDCAFETVGTQDTQAAALHGVGRGGCLMLMAGVAEGLALAPNSLAGERRITTSSNHLYSEYQMAVELLAAGRVRVGPMVSHRFPLDEAPRAFEVAANKPQHGALKVVIEP